jgi:multimeric flavodoxin WrbA
VVILGVAGGGRTGGNTAATVADLLAGAAEVGAEGELVELARGEVEPIADCSACIARGACTIEDGFDALLERVAAADVLVLATPLYWYGPSAQLKAFLDRWSCRLDRDEAAFRAAMRGKPAVLVVAQGERGFYEAAPALQLLDWTLRYLDMPCAGRIVVVGHARADYAADAPQREAVRAAGRTIAGGGHADVQPPWFHLRHTPGEPLGGVH